MKIIEINDESLKFDNGTYMYSEHYQNCCESHWADFSVMNGYNLNSVTGKQIDIKNVDFAENIEDYIQLVPDMGFNLIARDGSKYFVPCYASNNGYYSSDLTLRITLDEKSIDIDISDCQQWWDEY